MDTYFDDRWSTWIEKFCQNGKQNLKGVKEFQEIKKLKDWRNHLTHYKIHNLLLPTEQLPGTKSLLTMVGGKIIYLSKEMDYR